MRVYHLVGGCHGWVAAVAAAAESVAAAAAVALLWQQQNTCVREGVCGAQDCDMERLWRCRYSCYGAGGQSLLV